MTKGFVPKAAPPKTVRVEVMALHPRAPFDRQGVVVSTIGVAPRGYPAPGFNTNGEEGVSLFGPHTGLPVSRLLAWLRKTHRLGFPGLASSEVTSLCPWFPT